MANTPGLEQGSADKKKAQAPQPGLERTNLMKKTLLYSVVQNSQYWYQEDRSVDDLTPRFHHLRSGNWLVQKADAIYKFII